MKRDPVHMEDEIRPIVAEEFVERLQREGLEVVIVAFDSHHLHILVRVPDHNPRHWLGLAKKHTSHSLRQLGLSPEGGGILGEALEGHHDP